MQPEEAIQIDCRVRRRTSARPLYGQARAMPVQVLVAMGHHNA